MKFSTTTLLTTFTTLCLAAPAPAESSIVGPPITAPFNLKLKSDNDTLDGNYVTAQRVTSNTNGVYYAVLQSSKPTHGQFNFEGDALVFSSPNTHGLTYASSQTYDSPSNFPVVNFRTKDASPKGYDHGFATSGDDLEVKLGDNDQWWVCDAQISRGNFRPALALWKIMPAIYPPYPEIHGCSKVDVLVENIDS